MDEQVSGFVFLEDDAAFYQGISSVDDVVGLLEQLFYILSNNEVDDEVVFDLLLDDDRTKAMYGPHFNILFNNRLDDKLEIYTIHRVGP